MFGTYSIPKLTGYEAIFARYRVYFPAHLIQLDQVGESHGLKGIVFAVTKIKFYIITIFDTFIGFHFGFGLHFLNFFKQIVIKRNWLEFEREFIAFTTQAYCG